MRRAALLLLAVLVVMTALGTLSACSGEFKVEFYVDGKLVETEQTVDGMFSYTYTAPKKGVFRGWYRDPECTKPFEGRRVTKNTKLYGRVIYSPVDDPNFKY